MLLWVPDHVDSEACRELRVCPFTEFGQVSFHWLHILIVFVLTVREGSELLLWWGTYGDSEKGFRAGVRHGVFKYWFGFSFE